MVAGAATNSWCEETSLVKTGLKAAWTVVIMQVMQLLGQVPYFGVLYPQT